MFEQWSHFTPGIWSKEINVRDFIQKNYTPYDGDDSFLVGPTPATCTLWGQVRELMDEELKKGILDAETSTPSSITSHNAGYLNQDLETIVGFQSDKPLKRNIMPNGGIRTVELALNSYGYELDPTTKEIFTKYHKTHNTAVFQAYTKEMRACRHSHIITGLPDAYGRGRIVGDYRRVALYGVDRLIQAKLNDKEQIDVSPMTEEIVRNREEISEQIIALQDLKKMAMKYGFDISRPAQDVKEAIQWLYFGYLGAIKQQDGAAMSIGRNSTFLDIYADRDLKSGKYTEDEIQEFIDHFIMKLRMVRFLRIPEYNELFSGDPSWVSETIGGVGIDGRHLVTKTSYRILHTLSNLGPSPEPNLTILWSPRLPENFKKFCATTSIETSSIQYENDDLMRLHYGDDYTIACCVSAMKVGKEMQFFGARANLAKTLLYAINGGKDEITGEQIGPKYQSITSEYLDYDEVMERFNDMMSWLAGIYVDTLNVIHFMHDKYHYESLEMALHDTKIERTFATGIAGFSVVVDSLSAMKYAKVRTIRDDSGMVIEYEIEGDYPAYGNNDDRADDIAVELVQNFMNKIRKHHTYRDSIPTTSILTITSNVVYGKKTGATPDGRKAGQALAPGANPMHGRDIKGAVAALASVAKLPFRDSLDGISNTFSIIPSALGKTEAERCSNLCGLLDGYFCQDPHHINVNVMHRDTLLDAMDHPEKYPQLTIRVSGYAVRFVRLTREQQLDVINRTFHEHF